MCIIGGAIGTGRGPGVATRKHRTATEQRLGGKSTTRVDKQRMDDFFNNPAVQGGVAPFVAGLVVALVLGRVRLAGLSVVAAFATAVFFVAGFTFTPLTATRKIILLAFAAPIVGMLADFAFKPTKLGAVVLALAGGAGALWAFWPVLAQKEAAQAWLLGGTAVASVAWLVGFSQMYLSDNGVRAGAAGLGLGLGTGVAAILGASASYGLYGIALGAGAGAFLLPQMITGKKTEAGATFMLTAALIAGLIAAGAMVLAELRWYSVLVLALVPVAATLPVPEKAPLWLQAVLVSLYAFVVAGAACALGWQFSRGPAA